MQSAIYKETIDNQCRGGPVLLIGLKICMIENWCNVLLVMSTAIVKHRIKIPIGLLFRLFVFHWEGINVFCYCSMT